MALTRLCRPEDLVGVQTSFGEIIAPPYWDEHSGKWRGLVAANSGPLLLVEFVVTDLRPNPIED